jgi:hypothetical protein
MSKAAANEKYYRTLGWISILLPFSFLIPAGLYFLPFGIPYAFVMYSSMFLNVAAPLVGLILAIIVRKTRLGKAGIVINVLWILYNIAWIAALPEAIRHSKF